MTDTVTVPRWVAKTLSRQRVAMTPEGLLALAELCESAEEEIPWAIVRPLIARFEHDDEGRLAAARAQVDQLQGYATERLDELGVNLRDPRVLYEAVAVLALVHQCAVNGHENGALPHDEAEAIRALVRALGAALGSLAPSEARS